MRLLKVVDIELDRFFAGIREQALKGAPLSQLADRHGWVHVLRALGAKTVDYPRALDVQIELMYAAGHGRRQKLLDSWLQGFLFMASAIAIWLVAQSPPLAAWGFAIGLASQPAWFVSSWRARQWGIFFLGFFYTGAWVQGLVNYWHHF